MENNELNITWCYPDILNLHGDRGNIMALKRVAELLELKVNINKIENYQDEIDFENTDILFFNAGELKVVEPIVEALKSKKEELDNYIKKGKIIMAIGSTGAVFAQEVMRTDGSIVKGLGYLDMRCIEREYVYGDDLIYRLKDDENMKINGSQIQIIDTLLNDGIELGTLIYGKGNNGEVDKSEGAKYKNLIFTNCLGPVLVKNPWYAEKLIRQAMENKGIKIEKQIDKDEYEIERKSMECIKRFIDKKTSEEKKG